MNLPNKLTVLRVIMVPFFVFFMLTDVGGPANKWIALITANNMYIFLLLLFLIEI